MNKLQLKKYIIPFAVLLVAINSITTSVQYKTGVPIANTTFWWSIQAFILCMFFIGKNKFCSKKQANLMLAIQSYLLWNVFCIVHGVLVADNYWDWKGLVSNTMSLMIPSVAYAATNKELMQSIFRFFVYFGIPLFAVVILFVYPVAYGYYLAFISFLLLFLPVLPKRWKIIILGLTILVLTADLGARSNIIKFLVPLCFGLLYYVRAYLTTAILNVSRIILLALPLMLFFLALSGTFNVFKMSEYIEGDFVFEGVGFDGEIIEQNLKADTRTFLYVENIYSAEKYDYWLVGRSPARGYESYYFGHKDMTGRGERLGSEVSILNVFTWTGLVGVFLYFFIFYRASYLAINQSNNIFSQLVGLFVAFRWAYAWVEDFNNFNMFYFSLWLMIGMCFSLSFRVMSNKEVISWVRGIFDKKVRRK